MLGDDGWTTYKTDSCHIARPSSSYQAIRLLQCDGSYSLLLNSKEAGTLLDALREWAFDIDTKGFNNVHFGTCVTNPYLGKNHEEIFAVPHHGQYGSKDLESLIALGLVASNITVAEERNRSYTVTIPKGSQIFSRNEKISPLLKRLGSHDQGPNCVGSVAYNETNSATLCKILVVVTTFISLDELCVWAVWGMGKGKSLFPIPYLSDINMSIVGVEQDVAMFKFALSCFRKNNSRDGNKVKAAMLCYDSARFVSFWGIKVVFGYSGSAMAINQNHIAVMLLAFGCRTVECVIDTKVSPKFFDAELAGPGVLRNHWFCHEIAGGRSYIQICFTCLICA